MNQIPPVMRRLAKVDAAHQIFRSVLGPVTPDDIFKRHKILFSDDDSRIYENTATRRELAEAVLGIDFPRVVGGSVDLDHYTSLQSLVGIVGSGSFHLQTVARHLQSHEFTTFAGEHDLDGYFDPGQSGDFVYKELSDDLFFLSLTDPGHPNPTHMWNVFGGQGRGVRMHLRVTPKPAADLRRMKYSRGTPTAFKQINDALKQQEDLVYIPWGLSRICAFYLPSGYHREREVRLLIKRHVNGVDLTIKNGSREVWPVALVAAGQAVSDLYCGIELLEIEVGPGGSVQTVQNILAGTAYNTVPVR